MNPAVFAYLAAAFLLVVSPANAVTNDNGDILITQAAVNSGNITPGDAPGFPVTISQLGTYRFATNLAVTSAVNGIEVRANDVSIEMGGHTLSGGQVGRNGIASFNRNTKVEHGTVRGFTNDGVRSIAQFLSINDMVITANGRNGVFADDNASVFSNAVSFASIVGSKVSVNAIEGIQCGQNCRVENSAVSSNGGYEIYFRGTGGLALGNIVTDNGTGIFFWSYGGAGNNTVLLNGNGVQITGSYLTMQPNACNPACPPPVPPCSKANAC